MLYGFLAVAEMALRTFVRDRAALFWGVAFPLMLMGLIGSVFGGGGDLTLRASIVKADDNPLAGGIAQALKQVPVFRVVEEDEQTALAALQKGERSLVIVLPEAAAALEPAAVRVYYDAARVQVAQAGTAIVRQVIEEANRRLTGRPEVLTVAASGVSVHRLTMFDFLLPGMLAMVIMQTGLMGVTWVISSYRERRVLKRVLATPFPPFAFLAGLVARFTLTNLGQGAIILLVGITVFKATVVGSYLHLVALAVLGSIAFLSLGFAVSTLSRTPEAANTLGSAVGFPMMFLSGTFWPKEMIPDALQPVIGLLPLTPLVDAMRGVAALGDPLLAHAGGMAYLVAWTVCALAVATWRFRWE